MGNELITRNGADYDETLNRLLLALQAKANGAAQFVYDSNGTVIGLSGVNAVFGLDRTITISSNAILNDAGATVTANSSSAIVLTILNDATTGWLNDSALLLYQAGIGAVSFAAGSGVTLNASPSVPVAAQYVILGAVRVAANTWVTF